MSAKERLDILKERLDDLFTENQRLKQLCDRYEEEHNTTFEEWKKDINIINELEKMLEQTIENSVVQPHIEMAEYTLKELKELKGADKK